MTTPQIHPQQLIENAAADGEDFEPTEQQYSNVVSLCERLNRLLADREAAMPLHNTGIHLAINSGLRSPARNAAVGGAANSKHLTGHALDVSDPLGRIGAFLLANQHLLARHGLYMEHPSKTPTWVHLQDLPPRSRNLVFYP
jgi:hypothetical protein